MFSRIAKQTSLESPAMQGQKDVTMIKSHQVVKMHVQPMGSIYSKRE